MKLSVLYVKFVIVIKLLNILKSLRKQLNEPKLTTAVICYSMLEIFAIISLQSISSMMFASMTRFLHETRDFSICYIGITMMNFDIMQRKRKFRPLTKLASELTSQKISMELSQKNSSSMCFPFQSKSRKENYLSMNHVCYNVERLLYGKCVVKMNFHR